MSEAQIAALLLLPVFPKPTARRREGPEGRLHDSAGSSTALLARWIGKIVFLGFVVWALVAHGDDMPTALRHYTYAFGMWAFVGFLMDGPAGLLVGALGVELTPTFDQPWLSSSLTDFWARRWNIPTSSVLRTVVYDPIVDGSLVNPQWTPAGLADAAATASPVKPTKPLASPPAQHSHHQARHPHKGHRLGHVALRRLLALHATFFASGIIHEYIAWACSLDGRWHWRWTLFFSLQAPLQAAEWAAGRRLARAGVVLPRPLTCLATLALLEALAYRNFFGFVEWDVDLAQRVVAACSASYGSLLAPAAALARGLRGGGGEL